MTRSRRCTSRLPRAAVGAALIVTVALLITSCVTSVFHNCRWGPTVVKVRYEVTSSTGRADIEVLDAGGEVESYRRGQTPWRLTERIRGEMRVRLRARNGRPLGTVSVAIYVDDVLWKKVTGVGTGTMETSGVIESEPGWDCGYGMFVQTWPEQPEKPEKPEPPAKPEQPTVPQEPGGDAGGG
jgi:hypothetical protein